MITVSQLAAFDPSSWDRAAEWARAKGKKAREAQTELGSQADKLATAWPSWVGQLAVSAIRDQATAQGELATAYDDGATVIDDAALGMVGLRDQIKDLQATVAGTPDVRGPDDQGVVEATRAFSFTDIIEFLKVRALAGQLTITAREILMQATDKDRGATIALMALIGIDLPDTGDGPIDLTDEGIVLQADLNSQDRYGDCTTLSTLIGIAHSDPDFIRRHLVWDPATGTYQVTLYRDGEPVTVSVDPDSPAHRRLAAGGDQQAQLAVGLRAGDPAGVRRREQRAVRGGAHRAHHRRGRAPDRTTLGSGHRAGHGPGPEGSGHRRHRQRPGAARQRRPDEAGRARAHLLRARP